MPYAPLDLTGKLAVVTGGTSGIGHALTRALAEAGADVVSMSRRRELVDAVASEVEGLGRRTLRVVADVTDRGSLEVARSEIEDALGPVSVLVNCAGRTERVATLDSDETHWQAILDTNLMGTLRACQVFGRGMLERGQGSIVNIASLTSFVAFLEVAAYGASKAAVASLTQSLAVEWGPRGVNVNAIAPGVFPTALNRKLIEGTPRGDELILRTPLMRFGEAAELGGLAVFLASDAARFVNGQVIPVDGGFLASGANQ